MVTIESRLNQVVQVGNAGCEKSRGVLVEWPKNDLGLFFQRVNHTRCCFILGVYLISPTFSIIMALYVDSMYSSLIFNVRIVHIFRPHSKSYLISRYKELPLSSNAKHNTLTF